MFMGGGMTGGATESTAGCPWKGEPAGGENKCNPASPTCINIHLVSNYGNNKDAIICG